MTEREAIGRTIAIKRIVLNFLHDYGRALEARDRRFIEASLDVKDPFPQFYLLFKIHKHPFKTRPIVSVAGSILHGLSRWVDKQLQPVCKHLPSYVSSSLDFKKKISNLPALPAGTRLFTCDAVSMYTNIETDHALCEIEDFLQSSEHCADLSRGGVLSALKIIMRHNVFQFGDTWWHQLTGTAMGAPPAPVYATLYFAIHEIRCIFDKYAKYLRAYLRYLDDIFGAWFCEDPDEDEFMWNSFQADMDSFGQLQWEFSDCSNTVNFLDLTVLTTPNGGLLTSLFEKALNLYLYLPLIQLILQEFFVDSSLA